MIDIFHPMKFDFETLFYEVPEHENGKNAITFLIFGVEKKFKNPLKGLFV